MHACMHACRQAGRQASTAGWLSGLECCALHLLTGSQQDLLTGRLPGVTAAGSQQD
jgi:hypothetical protein